MRILSIVLAISLALLYETSFATTHSGYLTHPNNNPKYVDEYWTPERLRNAKPMPLPTVDPNKVQPIKQSKKPKHFEKQSGDGAKPKIIIKIPPQVLFSPKTKPNSLVKTFDEGINLQPFTSSRLIPTAADLVYPYSAVGKLYFTAGDQDFVCSASVIRPRIIVTAGHCVHSGNGTPEGFYTNWKFIPAYRDGYAPFLSWDASFVNVSEAWINSSGIVPNEADYAFLELNDQSIFGLDLKVGDITGYLGYQTFSTLPNHAHILGYPCNFDVCEKMHQITAQSSREIFPNNVEYGSDMQGGSSGGPWIQNFGELADGQIGGTNPGRNRIIGITSYGYVSTEYLSQGSSVPDTRFVELLDAMCSHKEGNC